MINLFCGFDEREAIGFSVFAHSVIARASRPVAIIPLSSMGLPCGSNTFTLSRFLVPHLMGYKGHAIFTDACDMLCLGDIAELDSLFDPEYAVQVVKHDYQTRHPRKYVGTPMECDNRDYERKNWASLMIVNAGHSAWKNMTPAEIEETPTLSLLQLRHTWGAIGGLPDEWNRLVDEGQPVQGAKIAHFTAGIPCIDAYSETPGADLWMRELDQIVSPAIHG